MDEQTRLDKQATAIRRLRKDRDALIERVNGLEERVEFLETALGALFQQDQPGQSGAAPSTTSPAQADQSSQGSQQADSRAVVAASPERRALGSTAIWSSGVIESGAVPLIESGTWIGRADCLICGAAKSAPHLMTCKGCSTMRGKAVAGEIERPAIPRCLNCGADKGPGGLMYVCPKCRAAAKRAGC